MKIKTARRYVFSTAFIATLLLGSVLATPQDRKTLNADQDGKILVGEEVALPVKGACPKPIALTLNATTPNVVNTHFTAAQLAAPRAFLNDPAPNRSFLYTFQWKSEERCCQITKAVLTVKMKANQAGTKDGSNAGNDGIAIMHLGSVVPPYSEPVYNSLPFSAGQTATKTWNLTGAALANLNATHQLPLYIQDDTNVGSATLQLWGCCLTTPRTGLAEEAQPALREN